LDNRRDELRATALRSLREHEVLMLDGHFDYGNGFHGSVYLNPHRIFRQPSLIWRLAQDLIAVLPDPIVSSTEVVAGPVMGGALFAHTLAGLLDARRDLTHPATQFAPLS
jgi:orotate phosphoribosyltransferase